ncbi:MAG: beta-lactamase family protein [Lachnospiraceae bacterium]|nr:beta-lactamase family protein [Lachnospiraceae bacterium]
MKNHHLRRIWNLLLTTVLMIVFCLPVISQAAEPDGSTDIGERIEAFVEEHEDTMAGLMVSVSDRKGEIYTGYFGYADMENHVPVEHETVMEWGSISKIQVWICVMQLKEKGLIDLDEDIRTYLPEGFFTRLKYEKPITMTDLMNHKAGFDEVPFVWVGSEERLKSLEDWLKCTEPAQVYEPGVIASYSNWGAALAALIVQRVSGQPYEEYVREYIFVPLGMEHTSIMPDASDNEWVMNKRKELKTYSDDLSGEVLSYGDYYAYCYPAGACMSTMEDMQKFAQALLDENSALFESPETHRELLSPTDYYGDTGIGRSYHGLCYNVFMKGTVIGHPGGTVGCSSALWIDIENGICITLITNQHEESTFVNGLPELVFERYEGHLPEFEGTVQDARAVYTGPLKLQRVFGMQSVTTDPSQIVHARYTLSDENGICRLEAGQSDLIVRETGEILPDIISIAVYILSLLMSAVLFIIAVVQILRHGRRGLSLWSMVSAGMQLIPLIVMYRVIVQLVFEQAPFLEIEKLRLLFVPVFALLMADIALIIYGIKNHSRSGISKARNVLTLITLALSTYGIIYWELFEFWRVGIC